MQNHVKNYFKAFGFHKGDFVACEMCGQPGTDIHHVEPRSKFGSKNKEAQDAPENLIALCRICHEFAHADKRFKKKIKEVINQRQCEQ